MKVEVTMYGQKDGEAQNPAIPQPLYRMMQWMTQTITVTMRTFGIAELRLDLVQSGVVPVSVVKFQPLRGMAVPPELEAVRPEIIRGMLMTAMQRFGIGLVKIQLSAEEQEELRTYWKYLVTGEQPAGSKDAPPVEDDTIFNNIPLPAEADPAPQPEA